MPTTHAAATVWHARAIRASSLAAALLLAAAMASYPGGTWCDARAPGHRFFQNYVCDLTWETALGGGDNRRGAALARAGMCAFGLALALTWALVARCARRRTVGVRALTPLAFVALVGILGVTMLPSETAGRLHAVVVLLATGPGLLAMALALGVLAREEPRPRAAGVAGLVVLALASVDVALYVAHLSRPVECAVLLPALQKVALVAVLQWMLFVASRAPHFLRA